MGLESGGWKIDREEEKGSTNALSSSVSSTTQENGEVEPCPREAMGMLASSCHLYPCASDF